MTGKGFIKTRNNLYPKKTMKKGPFRAKNACLPKIDPKHKRVMIPHVEVFSEHAKQRQKGHHHGYYTTKKSVWVERC